MQLRELYKFNPIIMLFVFMAKVRGIIESSLAVVPYSDKQLMTINSKMISLLLRSIGTFQTASHLHASVILGIPPIPYRKQIHYVLL